jgi:Zn-dependent alcohol dehydrogenase
LGETACPDFTKGAGYVQEVGSEVRVARAGDAVLLSFQSCSNCKDCDNKHPSYCQNFAALNYPAEQHVFTTPGGSTVAGAFFGQSSFCSIALVKEASVVNVSTLINHEEELQLFAPLGCGFQTGVGTVDVLAAAQEKDSIVILGLGGVGLAAVMVIDIPGCPIFQIWLTVPGC